MTESAPYDLEGMFVALGDPTRRGVVDLLRRRPIRASDLAEALRTSRPAMSRHLGVLRRSGLVETTNEPDARVRVYRLRQQPFIAMRTWLQEVEAFWKVELGAFAEHVERTRGKKR
jgi:DNA-binding transcriptional ArsR family regulator